MAEFNCAAGYDEANERINKSLPTDTLNNEVANGQIYS